MAASFTARPMGSDPWAGASGVARETIRELAGSPGGRRVVDLEKRLGQPVEVVRTLNRLQQAGLVSIQIEPGTMELMALASKGQADALRELLKRIS